MEKQVNSGQIFKTGFWIARPVFVMVRCSDVAFEVAVVDAQGKIQAGFCARGNKPSRILGIRTARCNDSRGGYCPRQPGFKNVLEPGRAVGGRE